MYLHSTQKHGVISSYLVSELDHKRSLKQPYQFLLTQLIILKSDWSNGHATAALITNVSANHRFIVPVCRLYGNSYL